MRFAKVEPFAIAHGWAWIGPLLGPAVAHDPSGISLDTVRAKLESGQCELAVVTADGGSVLLVTEDCVVDGVRCCWLSYFAGAVPFSPRKWVGLMRDGMGLLELAARATGQAEIRIGGRDWSRVFPDFERFDDVPNRLRKVL